MKKISKNNSSAGKGDAPRNCFSKKFKENYDQIDWGARKAKTRNNFTQKFFYK